MGKGINIFFLDKAGALRVEKCGSKVLIFEAQDGMHPIPLTSVLRKEEDGKEPIILIADEVLSPLGGDTSKRAVSDIMITLVNSKFAGKKINISTQLGRLFVHTMRYFPYIIVGLILLSALIRGG